MTGRFAWSPITHKAVFIIAVDDEGAQTCIAAQVDGIEVKPDQCQAEYARIAAECKAINADNGNEAERAALEQTIADAQARLAELEAEGD